MVATVKTRAVQSFNPETIVPTSVPMIRNDESMELRAQVAELSQRLGKANAVISNLKKRFEPDYKSLQDLFSDLEAVPGAGLVDAGPFEIWKQKLGGACSRMIDALLQKGEVTRIQLATLTSQSPRSGSFATNLAKLNTNGLIEKEGDRIRLRRL